MGSLEAILFRFMYAKFREKKVYGLLVNICLKLDLEVHMEVAGEVPFQHPSVRSIGRYGCI